MIHHARFATRSCPSPDPFSDDRWALECSSAADIRTWDVTKQKALAQLPMHNMTLHAMFFDPEVKTLGALVWDRKPPTSLHNNFDLVYIDSSSGALTKQGSVLLPRSLSLQGSTFSAANGGVLALLMVEETGNGDWSRGDPKRMVTVQVQTRTHLMVNTVNTAMVNTTGNGHDHSHVQAPQAHTINVLDVMPECGKKQDLRYYRASIAYLEPGAAA
jgi:hypothetical protein